MTSQPRLSASAASANAKRPGTETSATPAPDLAIALDVVLGRTAWPAAPPSWDPGGRAASAPSTTSSASESAAPSSALIATSRSCCPASGGAVMPRSVRRARFSSVAIAIMAARTPLTACALAVTCMSVTESAYAPALHCTCSTLTPILFRTTPRRRGGTMTQSWRGLLGPYGIWRPVSMATPPLAAELEQLGYGALWLGGSPRADLAIVDRLLAATNELVVATGIVNIWQADAHEVAASFARIEGRHPGRFLLGIGAGHPEAVQQYARPYDAIARYLDTLFADGVPGESVVLAA